MKRKPTRSRRILVPEVTEKIDAMRDKSPLEVSRVLKMNVSTVHNYMVLKGYHKTKPYTAVSSRKLARAAQEGFFNVHERENWLI